jgi:membrane protease YdiL (CAAX protease family)
MQTPGTASLVFLGYLLLFLPWAALRSARRLRAGGQVVLPPRTRLWSATLIQQGMLLVLAWFTARSYGDQPLRAPAALEARHLLAALGALALYFGLRAVARALHSEEERQRLVVFQIAPRTTPEWALWIAVVLVASVAEELAYRGVAMSILWYALGTPWPGVFLSATAFALAHAVQGGKSALVIFAMALVMHGLVFFTQTLWLAIAVHALYDFVAGGLIAREARRREDAA